MRAISLILLTLLLARDAAAQWTGQASKPLLVSETPNEFHSLHPDGNGGAYILFDRLSSRHYDANGPTSSAPHVTQIVAYPGTYVRQKDGGVWVGDGDFISRLDNVGKETSIFNLELSEHHMGQQALASRPHGGVVAFFAANDTGRVYANAVDGNGAVQWSSPILVDPTIRWATPPTLHAVTDMTGGAYCWYLHTIDTVILHRVSASGAVLWSIKVGPQTSGSEDIFFQATSDSAGGLYAMWMDDMAVGLAHITAEGALTQIESEDEMPGNMFTRPDGNLQLIGLKNSDYVGQIFDRTGNTLWAEPKLLYQPAEANIQTVVLANDLNGFAILTHEEADFRHYFMVSRFNYQGEPMWTPSAKLAAAPDDVLFRFTPSIALSGDNVYIAWYEAMFFNLWIQALGKNGDVLAGVADVDLVADTDEVPSVSDVYDVLGRQIFRIAPGEVLQDRMNNLPGGTYFVKTGNKLLHYRNW